MPTATVTAEKKLPGCLDLLLAPSACSVAHTGNTSIPTSTPLTSTPPPIHLSMNKRALSTTTASSVTQPTTTMDPMLQHLLETDIQQQAVTQELTQSLCTTTQKLLELKRKSCSITSVPLPDPCQEMPHILTKLTSEDDIEAFLLIFEWAARHDQCEEEHWANILTPFLSGEAQHLLCPSTWPSFKIPDAEN